MGIEHITPTMLVFLILLLTPLIFALRYSKNFKDRYIRRMPGIDAIDEAVGRAAELGRPISFTTGLSGLGPVLYACLGILHSIAKKTAQFRTKLLVPQNQPDVLVISEDVIREAYKEVGRGDTFDPSTLPYLSDEQFAFASGYMGMIHREQVASAFLFGSFAAESLILAEAGQQVGAMQVAGCVSPEQVPFFICSCDYTLIGEELYAASAYLTRERVQLSSLIGQDWGKIILLIIVLVGTSIATWNSISLNDVPNFDQIMFLSWGDLF